MPIPKPVRQIFESEKLFCEFKIYPTNAVDDIELGFVNPETRLSMRILTDSRTVFDFAKFLRKNTTLAKKTSREFWGKN